MQIGPKKRYGCPFCGGDKELANVKTGNSCRGRYWSDGYSYLPSLPMLSPVQQCPHCGKYYFLDDAERLPSLERDIFEEQLQQLYEGLDD